MHHIFLVLLSLLFLTPDQQKLVKTKISDDITVAIPQGWRPMDDMDFRERYPSVRAPVAAFTNADRNADFSINVSATQWPDANLEVASKFFRASLSNLVDRVDMIHEGTREVNGKHYIYFEFESRVNGSRTEEGNADPVLRYSYIQYLIQPRRTLVFSFHCPRRDRQAWQDAAAEMMDRIRVK